MMLEQILILSLVGRQRYREYLAAKAPSCLQHVLTWLTAVPHAGESRPKRSPLTYGAIMLVQCFAGVCISIYAIHCSLGWLSLCMLAAGWILTTGAMGSAKVVIYHYCAHGTVFKTRRANTTAGHVLSIILLQQEFSSYRQEHLLHHGKYGVVSDTDEYRVFLRKYLGMESGMPVWHLWVSFGTNFVSPLTHSLSLVNRIRSTFLAGTTLRRALAAGYWITCCSLVSYFHAWRPFILVWLVPLTVLLHAASCIRTLVEHCPPGSGFNKDTPADLDTIGVFLGRPPLNDGFLAWTAWISRVLLYDIPLRLAVMVGDTPCHDWHHHDPSSRDWPQYIHARAAAVSRANDREVFYEIWGVWTAIRHSIACISKASLGDMPQMGPSRQTTRHNSEIRHRGLLEPSHSLASGIGSITTDPENPVNYYVTPRNGGKSIYELWEDGKSFGDSVTPSTYAPLYQAYVSNLLQSLAGQYYAPVLVSVGSGNAMVEARVKGAFLKVFALDVNQAACSIAISKGLVAVHADVRNWQPPTPVHIIYADGVMGHLVDEADGLRPVLARMKSWLAPVSGILLLMNDISRSSDSLEKHPTVENFYWFSTQYLHSELERSGFSIKHLEVVSYTRPLTGCKDRAVALAVPSRA